MDDLQYMPTALYVGVMCVSMKGEKAFGTVYSARQVQVSHQF